MKMSSIKNFTEQTQINAFGCLEADLDLMIEHALFDDATMMAMSAISDAQELMKMDNTQEARQYMNRAKYYLWRKRNDILRKHWYSSQQRRYHVPSIS